MRPLQLHSLSLRALSCALLFSASAADTWYVDDDAPNDPGPGDPTLSDALEDGSALRPFDSVQEALNAAASGDEVVLADGLYTGLGNRELSLGGKTLLVRGENGSATSVIDCEEQGRAFDLAGSLDVLTLRGLTIRNGLARAGGALRMLAGSSLTVEQCQLESCTSFTHGGALYSRDSFPILRGSRLSQNLARGSHGGAAYVRGGGLAVRNCLIDRNSCSTTGGGVYVDSCLAALDGCTFADNLAQGFGGALVSDWSTTQIRGSVLWGDEAGLLVGPEIAAFHSTFGAAWCDVEGDLGLGTSSLQSAFGWDLSNSSLDPLFVDPLAGDYHLDASSPCIDSGDPSYVPEPGELDIDGEARIQSSFVDRGADERP